jgi:hypothetical protein
VKDTSNEGKSDVKIMVLKRLFSPGKYRGKTENEGDDQYTDLLLGMYMN